MSMKKYPISEMGIVLKVSEVDQSTVLKDAKEETDKKITYSDDLIDIFDCCNIWLGEHWEDGTIALKQGFGGGDADGEFKSLIDNMTLCLGDEDINVSRDDWVIFCLPRYPSLFKQAYNNETSLLTEMKQIYSRYIKDEDFNYVGRLVEYGGTIYG